MFEFLKFRKQERRQVVVALHGFGRRRTDEFLPLKNFLAAKNIELIMPELFNPRNPQDVDPQKWIQRAEEVVDQLAAQNAEVILVGFSMGGVIAAHLAAVDLLKQDAALVECPVLIFHGTDDETISVSSSRKIYKKIPAAQKGLIMLEGVGHAILDDPVYASLALNTIAAFIADQFHF